MPAEEIRNDHLDQWGKETRIRERLLNLKKTQFHKRSFSKEEKEES